MAVWAITLDFSDDGSSWSSPAPSRSDKNSLYYGQNWCSSFLRGPTCPGHPVVQDRVVESSRWSVGTLQKMNAAASGPDLQVSMTMAPLTSPFLPSWPSLQGALSRQVGAGMGGAKILPVPTSRQGPPGGRQWTRSPGCCVLSKALSRHQPVLDICPTD